MLQLAFDHLSPLSEQPCDASKESIYGRRKVCGFDLSKHQEITRRQGQRGGDIWVVACNVQCVRIVITVADCILPRRSWQAWRPLQPGRSLWAARSLRSLRSGNALGSRYTLWSSRPGVVPIQRRLILCALGYAVVDHADGSTVLHVATVDDSRCIRDRGESKTSRQQSRSENGHHCASPPRR